MRKTTAILILLFVCLTVAAQNWTPVDERQYDDETIVYASLWNHGNQVKDDFDESVVAAFIDDECRAVAEVSYASDDGVLLIMRVVGNRSADKGKKVQFRVYDSSARQDFNLTAEREVLFTGESEGLPSQPIALSYSSPASLTVADIYLYKGQTVNLYDYLIVSPANSTLPNGIGWSVDGDVATVEGNLLKAVATGETTYSLIIYNKVIATARVVIEAGAAPQGFIVTFDSIAAGESKLMTLTPIPEEAAVNAAWYHLEMTGSIDGWEAADCELASTEPLAYRVTPLYPGWVNVRLNNDSIPLYAESGRTYTGFEAAAPLRLKKGWQWVTNAFNSVAKDEFWKVYGGNALTEIRTQENLLYNDSEMGYFGTLMQEGLSRNTAYKVLMSGDNHFCRLYGAYVDTHLSVALEGPWTWLPLPFCYDRLVGHAFANANLPTGLTLISKNHGSAEWSGSEWVGDMKVLPAGESLLCYDPSDQDFVLTFADETAMSQGDEQPANEARRGTWEYDDGAYRDNTTMVAVVESLPCPDEYSIGAFVDGECRGEGVFTDGFFFITIHAARSERVRFVLRHETTGMQYAIDEWVPSGMRHGSIARPFLLHSSEWMTGIGQLGTSETMSADVYDMMGRRVAPSNSRGILLRRMDDGRVRKILVR